MSWMNQLDGLLRQYADADPAQAPPTVEDDFDALAQTAPPAAAADGLAAAFRDERTPPFPNMLGQSFARSSGQQRAGIRNTLIAALGPTVVQQILARRGGGGFGLDQILGGGGSAEVTPEMAEQFPLGAVEEIAGRAEQQDPSILDRLSDIYARNPGLIKVLGGAALAVALSKIAQPR